MNKQLEINRLKHKVIELKVANERLIEKMNLKSSVTVSSIKLEPSKPLSSFKMHSDDIDAEILKSEYLTLTQNEALSEVRYLLLNCHKNSIEALQFEKRLIAGKSLLTSPTSKLGMLMNEILELKVLERDIKRQIVVASAVYELERMSNEFDISSYDLFTQTARQILDESNVKSASMLLVQLRKARITGDIKRIDQSIELILDGN